MNSSTRLRHAVIGVGGIGKYHAQWAQLVPEVELASIVDVDRGTAEAAAAGTSAAATTNVETVLRDSSIEAISIAVPHHRLAELAIRCLMAGKHVLIEKPGALRAVDIERMGTIADEKNLCLSTCFQHRFFGLSQLLKQTLPRIGPIRRVFWTASAFRPNAFWKKSPWKGEWGTAGAGLLMHQLVHQLDLLCWLFGTPRSVAALVANHQQPVPLEDVAAAIVEFAEGALCSVQASMNEPGVACARQIVGLRGLLTAPDVQSIVYDRHDEIRLGIYQRPLDVTAQTASDPLGQPTVRWETLTVPGPSPAHRRWLRPNRLWQRTRFWPAAPGDPHRRLFQAFVDAVRKGTEVPVPAQDIRTTLELANGLQVAALTGRSVELPVDPDLFEKVLRDLAEGNLRVRRYRHDSEGVE